MMMDNRENGEFTDRDDIAKTNALVAYILMVLGLFTGVFWLAGAFWAMVKKSEAQGTRFEDHYSNIISTFWWGLGLTILGFLFMVVIVGYFLLIAVWIWSIYRIVTGLAKITSNRSYNA